MICIFILRILIHIRSISFGVALLLHDQTTNNIQYQYLAWTFHCILMVALILTNKSDRSCSSNVGVYTTFKCYQQELEMDVLLFQTRDKRAISKAYYNPKTACACPAGPPGLFVSNNTLQHKNIHWNQSSRNLKVEIMKVNTH